MGRMRYDFSTERRYAADYCVNFFEEKSQILLMGVCTVVWQLHGTGRMQGGQPVVCSLKRAIKWASVGFLPEKGVV